MKWTGGKNIFLFGAHENQQIWSFISNRSQSHKKDNTNQWIFLLLSERLLFINLDLTTSNFWLTSSMIGSKHNVYDPDYNSDNNVNADADDNLKNASQMGNIDRILYLFEVQRDNTNAPKAKNDTPI